MKAHVEILSLEAAHSVLEAKEFVDPNYRTLVRALKREAEKWLPEGASVLYRRIVRESGNTAWLVLSLRDTDNPLLLFYGVTTTDPDKGDAGVSISQLPFDSKILPLLGIASTLYDDYVSSCECGHQLTKRRIRHTKLNTETDGWICCACGNSDANTDVWELVD